ncbi:hypothetical protein ACSSS7_007344 [Eimeria intestinalis]
MFRFNKSSFAAFAPASLGITGSKKSFLQLFPMDSANIQQRLRSRVSGAEVPYRRLAEGGRGEEGEDGDELRANLEACLDYEKEHYFLTSPRLPSHTGPSSSSAVQAGPPQRTESPIPLPSGVGLGPQLPPAESDASPGSLLDDSGWATSYPPYPQLDPQAWLDQIPELGPEAWLEQIRDIMGSGIDTPLAEPGAQGILEDDAQPSTSAATEKDPSSDTTQDGELANHPYVRLLPKALSQLKERRRPSDEEIIDIKRQLYFATSYFFRHALWDTWREHDRAHQPPQDASSRSQDQGDDHQVWIFFESEAASRSQFAPSVIQPELNARLRAKFFSRQSLQRSALKKASLIVLAFFLTGLVFTAFCRRLRSRVSEAGLPYRRLAEGGRGEEEDDDELETILEACLDYEKEHYFFTSPRLPSHTGPSSSSAAQVGPPQRSESVGALWPSFASQWLFPLPPPPYDVPPASALQPIPLPSEVGLGPQLPPAEGGTSPGSLLDDSGWATSYPPYPQLDPQAWLDQIPDLDPEAWLDQIPDIVGSGIDAPSAEPGAQGILEDDAQPSTSAATQEGPSSDNTQDGELANHPYVRLPPLRPGVVTRTIRVHEVAAGPLEVNASSSYEILSAMRRLLAKPELSSTDAEALLQVVELILGFVENRIKPKVGPRHYAAFVSRLGIYFLLFDAVLAANEILGPAMQIETWWREFQSSFRTEYPELDDSMAPEGGRDVALQNFLLARRLQKALRQLKQRRRLSNQEIIDIKRQLYFANAYYFRRARWDPWREDDRAHRSQEDASSESQDQDDDYQG